MESNQLATPGEWSGSPIGRFRPFSDCSCTARPDIFSPAASNDWVQYASPDVISSNVCCTDLSQTLALACRCHMDHLIAWVYVIKTRNLWKELHHIHLGSISSIKRKVLWLSQSASGTSLQHTQYEMTGMVFPPPAVIFKCMFQFHCITKWIRGAGHELFKRPCYLLIMLCSSFSSMTTAVKDSYRLKGYCAHE